LKELLADIWITEIIAGHLKDEAEIRLPAFSANSMQSQSLTAGTECLSAILVEKHAANCSNQVTTVFES